MNNRYDSLSSVTLNGHTASEFERVNSILEDDVLLVETDMSSVGTSWSTFREDVIERTFDGLGFGSMYDQDENSYSVSDHNHDSTYNGVTIGDSHGDAELLQVRLDYQHRDQAIHHVYAHKYKGIKPEEPRIGSLKFVYGKRKPLSFPSCIRNSEFDGWVYTNNVVTRYGTYQLDLSREELMNLPAYQVLGNGDPQNPQIVVPSLTGFFKPVNFPIQSFFVRNGRNGEVRHYHPDAHPEDTMSLQLSYQNYYTDVLRLYVGSHSKDNKYARNIRGGNSSRRVYSNFSINTGSMEMSGKTDTVGDDDNEPRPAHNRLLVMVYIGRRTKPYDTV